MSAPKLDPFEARLARQPLRRPPPEWRGEILAVASRARPRARESAAMGALSSLYSRLSSVLWPSPVAWGGLAAIWLVLLTFHATSPAEIPATAKVSSTSVEQLRYAFRDQSQLLKELIGPSETAEPKRRSPPSTKPRTELRASDAAA